VVLMEGQMTQDEFEAQWRPIPREDFPLPACPERMALLKAFADPCKNHYTLSEIEWIKLERPES